MSAGESGTCILTTLNEAADASGKARLDQSCVPAWQPLMVPSLEKEQPLAVSSFEGGGRFSPVMQAQ